MTTLYSVARKIETTFYNVALEIETSWAKTVVTPIFETWDANDVLYMFGLLKNMQCKKEEF